jgi:hypothetical protein
VNFAREASRRAWIVIGGAGGRLRPLPPSADDGARDGDGGEQNAPLGRADIGGLLIATAATLFFVPTVCSLLHAQRGTQAAHASKFFAPNQTPDQEYRSAKTAWGRRSSNAGHPHRNLGLAAATITIIVAAGIQIGADKAVIKLNHQALLSDRRQQLLHKSFPLPRGARQTRSPPCWKSLNIDG